MPPESNRSSRLESSAFYLLLAGVILAPLAFWPSQYFALESAKTLIIGLVTLAAMVVLLILAVKNKSFRLPSRSIVTIGVLMAVSIIASAISSGHFMKSFFGQGFELGAGSFLMTLLIAGIVAFMVVSKKADRAIVIYAGLFGTYIIVWILQTLRILIGPKFVTLGFLTTVTSSITGSWFTYGLFSLVIALLSILAVSFLRLSTKIKTAYWVLFVLSAVSMFIVNSVEVWQATFVVFLGLTIYLSTQNRRVEGGVIKAFFKRLAWLPLIVTIVAGIFVWQGKAIAGPVIDKLGAGYSELSLPWRMTIDVAAGELKQNPFFGAGPNRFSQAYISNKPAGINQTDAWSVEFNSGFGLIPTFLVTQGFFGGIMWVLFFVYFAILGVKSLRGFVRAGGSGESINEVERPYARFIIISSYATAAAIWITALIYVPTHAMVYLGFVLTGLWLGTSAAYGRLRPLERFSSPDTRSYRVIQIIQFVMIVVAVLWAVVYIKNTIALANFGSGVQHLTVTGNSEAADAAFEKALALNPLDIYWQARAEAGISRANKLLATITATTDSASSTAIITKASEIVNKSIEYTNNAIKADSQNYNNFVSQARVAEVATIIRMKDGYETAVGAYTNAIRNNPQNPVLYLSLARLQAQQNNLDSAIQTIGVALQVKSNYLDAVYLLSQVEAAKGNLADAITAARFATQLNTQNPLLFFQLGLLQYNKGDYADAVTALEQANKLQANYANAQYFLGLAYARVNKTAEAIATFEKLTATNPDNNEIAVILSTLRSGKSLFTPTAPAPTAAAARPEKRSTLPIKER